MKKIVRTLTAVLVFSMLLSLCIVGTNAATASGNAVLKWDFLDEEQMSVYRSDAPEWVLWTDSDGYVHRDHGGYTVNKEEGAYELFWSPADANGTYYKFGNYRMMPRMATSGLLPDGYVYARVEYKAKNPVGEPGAVKLHTINNGAWEDRIYFSENVQDTNGKYVLSDVGQLSDTSFERLNRPSHLSLLFSATKAGGEYGIRAIYFFASKADAEAFKLGDTSVALTAAADLEVAEDPSTWKDPFVLDLTSSAKRMKSAIELYLNPQFGDEDGTWEQDSKEKALLLTYSDSKRADYRLSFRVRGTELSRYDESYRYLRVTYKTDYALAFPMVIVNNGDGTELVLESDTSKANGKWVTTQVVDLAGTSFMTRLVNGNHFTMGVRHTMEGAKIWIKEIALFASEQQAYAYYNDVPESKNNTLTWNLSNSAQTTYHTDFSETWTLWKNEETGEVHYDHGSYVKDEASGSMKLLYSPADATGKDFMRGNYRIMPKFTTSNALPAKYRYARILYSAKNPTGEDGPVELRMENNGGWGFDMIRFEKDVQDTNGEFVLSAPADVSQMTLDRLNKPSHMTLYFNASGDDGEYYVKSIYFFETLAEAKAFTAEEAFAKISIAGTDISEYQIVIGEDAAEKIRNVADGLQAQLEIQTGVRIPVVFDTEAETDHEILIGNTNRKASLYYYGAENGIYMKDLSLLPEYEFTVRDGKFCLVGGSAYATKECVLSAMTLVFGYGAVGKVADVDLEEGFTMSGNVNYGQVYTYPEPEEGVVETWTDDFEDETKGASPDYWLEHALTDFWKVTEDKKGLVYTADADAMTYSWLHVFERDVEYSAKMKIDKAGEEALAGMLLRFNEDEAYIRVGYDFETKEWYLRDKQGDEFEIMLYDTAKAELPLGEWFTLKAVLNRENLKVYLNDGKEPILATDQLHHITPGRVGFFAEDAVLSVDDVKFVGVSGQGKVQKGVVELPFGHRELDTLNGSQGNSIYELEDGSLVVMPLRYRSTDGGITWNPISESLPGWGTGAAGGNLYHIIRLQSGKLLNVKQAAANKFVAQYSEDDGMTWKDGGTIVNGDYMGYGTTKWINMNDKLTQMSDGRIFMTMNGDGYIPADEPNSHGRVFIELYYSDDDGMTWTRSEDSSFDICEYGFFGESVVIEGQNGQLVWLTTWSDAPELLYSVSDDNGVTWSEAKQVEKFAVSRSSSCIKRDYYADELTYYMVSVFNEPLPTKGGDSMPRSRLGLFRTHDGIHWEYLCDMDRWESNFRVQGFTTMYVNPSITVTEDYVYVGSGRSEFVKEDDLGHHGQTQMFIRFEKDELHAYDVWPTYFKPEA